MTSSEVLTNAQDSDTYHIGMITTDHKMIHEGKMFSIDKIQAALATSAAVYIGIRTPAVASGYVHLRPGTLSSSADVGRVSLIETVSFSAGDEYCPINHSRHKELTHIAASKVWLGVTPVVQTTIVTTKAGGNFGNQPAGDGVEIVSDAAGDTTQTVTIYGTITGTTDSVTSETKTLTGTDAVSTTIVTWETILGVELSAACTGTITVREASADQTITTIAPAALSAGVETPTSTVGKGLIPQHLASGASTKKVGIIGTAIDVDGTAQSTVDALNGAVEENHLTRAFRTITKVLIGDVASATNVSIKVNCPVLYSTSVGTAAAGGSKASSGAGAPAGNEYELKAETDYAIKLENVGATNASTLDFDVLFYELVDKS